MSSVDPARVFLGLGTNMGNREANLRDAIRRIAQIERTEILRCSSVYETEPWGFHEQDLFLNCVLEIFTVISPQALFESTRDIETALGRTPSAKYHPRIIDIDILFYGAEDISSECLTIPHPGIPFRRFALVPLAELAPDLYHHTHGGTMLDLLAVCSDMGRVWKTEIQCFPLKSLKDGVQSDPFYM